MRRICYLLLAFTLAFTACDDDNDGYVLQRADITVVAPEGGYVAEVGKVFRLKVNSVSDEGVTYQWLQGNTVISQSKNLEYTFKTAGQYTLKLRVAQGCVSYDYNVVVNVKGKDEPLEHQSPYITKVLEYLPAVGQFTNELPKYVKGDTQEDMNRKALDAIGHNNLGIISLGGFGGYVIVGFDHTIRNVAGKRDFRVLGNAFDAAADASAGSSEPGVIMVSYDENKNGKADDAWYEIAGSAHRDASQEPWIAKAQAAGNDVNLYRNYEITYHRPEVEPKEGDYAEYIRWEDNQGNQGFKAKNAYHNQPYYPLWVKEDQLTFKGTCLPQNGIDESGEGTCFVCFRFGFGYADNDLNTSDGSTIDIDWAMTSDGRKVHLPGIDFIKIYSGVNQENGWIGECSTEVTGVEDLHILGESIDSPAL